MSADEREAHGFLTAAGHTLEFRWIEPTAPIYSRYGFGQSDPLAEARDVEYLSREALTRGV